MSRSRSARAATSDSRSITALFAVLNAGPTGFDSLTSVYSSAPGLFGYHWSCGGGKIVVRKPTDFPGVEIKFVGNSSANAVVSSVALGVPYAGS